MLKKILNQDDIISSPSEFEDAMEMEDAPKKMKRFGRKRRKKKAPAVQDAQSAAPDDALLGEARSGILADSHPNTVDQTAKAHVSDDEPDAQHSTPQDEAAIIQAVHAATAVPIGANDPASEPREEVSLDDTLSGILTDAKDATSAEVPSSLEEGDGLENALAGIASSLPAQNTTPKSTR